MKKALGGYIIMMFLLVGCSTKDQQHSNNEPNDGQQEVEVIT